MSDDEANPQIPRGGVNPNISLEQQAINHDTSAAMTSVLECLTLQQSTYNIPVFDGRDPPLREFLQDVANGSVFITDATEPAFVKAVYSKLRGAARESCRDKCFNRISELTDHLNKRFAPTKKYQWYFESIMTLRLRQSETVGDYYDRLRGLISGAKHALESKYNKRYVEVGEEGRPQQKLESTIIMQPVIDCALESFIRGLPEEMSIFVDTRNPANLEEALEHAIRAEERQKYSEKSRASSYHITRAEDRPRPTSPYSRQVEKTSSTEKRKIEPDRESTSPNKQRHSTSNMLQLTPEQLAQLYRFMIPQISQPITYQPPPPQSMIPVPNAQYQHVQYHQHAPYPRQSHDYKTSVTPPRSISPAPQGNLNFQSARRSDATASPTPQRHKTVQFAENTVGSLEQEQKPRTPQ